MVAAGADTVFLASEKAASAAETSDVLAGESSISQSLTQVKLEHLIPWREAARDMLQQIAGNASSGLPWYFSLPGSWWCGLNEGQTVAAGQADLDGDYQLTEAEKEKISGNNKRS